MDLLLNIVLGVSGLAVLAWLFFGDGWTESADVEQESREW